MRKLREQQDTKIKDFLRARENPERRIRDFQIRFETFSEEKRIQK